MGSGVLIHSGTNWLRIITLGVTSGLMSCGGGGGGGDSAPAPSAAPPPVTVTNRPTSLSDLDIAARLYAGTHRTPADFASDQPPTSYTYVSTQHLKNTDVAAVSTGTPEYELCTNDWNEALNWSELQQQRLPQYADLVATDDEARFFEFGRVRTGEPQFYLRGRVFKCSYLDRAGTQLQQTSGAAGVLKPAPLDAAALKSLSEYLWQFTTYNNYGHLVLTSRGSSNAAQLHHALTIASLTRAGISSTCDRVSVIDWTHHANIGSGELSRAIEPLWSFGARESNGVVELCSI